MRINLKDWKGGEMPIPKGTAVLVKHRSKELYTDFAGESFAQDWEHLCCSSDIVAFCVLDNPSKR